MINRRANDPHIEVVRLILKENAFPDKFSCRECFQPKLYHVTSAFIIKLLEMEDNPANDQIEIMQFINFIAGLVILGIAWLFLEKLPFKQTILKSTAFALLALNPKLIYINSQSTNDTFAILFSTLALYCTYLFLKRSDKLLIFLIIVTSSLALVSKTNTWVTSIAIFFTLFIKTFFETETRRRSLAYALFFLLSVSLLTFINPISQYIHNVQEFGAPVTINIEKRPPFPKIFGYTPGCESKAEGFNCHAGILSLKSGFLTFRLYDLLAYPRLEKGFSKYPTHRTSFWAQIYARSYSAIFDNWPNVWKSQDTSGFFHSRWIFLLALIPTFLLLVGAFYDSFDLIKGLLRKNILSLQRMSFGLFIYSIFGYVIFTVAYAAFYRDFTTMKAIFIFPALLSFPLFYMQGVNLLQEKLKIVNQYVFFIIYLPIIGLIILYIYDILFLINHLRSLA